MPSKQITDYLVISNANPMQLSIKVNEKIQEGWVPLAGVSVGAALSESNTLVSYAQAVVKYKVVS